MEFDVLLYENQSKQNLVYSLDFGSLQIHFLLLKFSYNGKKYMVD